MAANYSAFTVWDEDEYGVRTAAASQSVVLYNLTQASVPAESPLTTDANGLIAASSLAAGSSGDRASFRVDNRSGISGTIVQQLT